MIVKVKVNTIAMLAMMAACFTATISCSNEDVPVCQTLMAKQGDAVLSLVKATDVEMKKYQTESDLWHGGEDVNYNNGDVKLTQDTFVYKP